MYLAVERKWIVSLGHVSHLLLMVWENSTCRLDNPNINAIRMEENKGNSICALFLNFRIIPNENSYDANVSIWQNYRDYIDIFDESIHLMSNYLSNVESLKSREWNLNSPIWTQTTPRNRTICFIHQMFNVQILLGNKNGMKNIGDMSMSTERIYGRWTFGNTQ